VSFDRPESLVTDEVSALHFERFKLSQVLQTLPVEVRYTSEELSKVSYSILVYFSWCPIYLFFRE
jgi:hypothetical protein